MLRIGRRVAVSLPNFGYWKVRGSLALLGRMPRTRTLDYTWYDTPNIHLCTLADFVDLTQAVEAIIVEAHALDIEGRTQRMRPDAVNRGIFGPNFTAPGAIFLLKKNERAPGSERA
jgi:methionine biosynthesis protein MetW